MVDIWAGCTNFPTPRSSSRGNELLELDRNSTIYRGDTTNWNAAAPLSGTGNKTGSLKKRNVLTTSPILPARFAHQQGQSPAVVMMYRMCLD
ncbi:MAG: hypothetical protein Q9175_002802 [Cornicularia normoerica]